ncbi:MAG: MBL fold metallo-hydrolase [Burkholderiaceae bacterium]
MNITVLGAAREVTGSCLLVETQAARFLVDCGMVQGGREAPARNRQPFAFDPRRLDFVLLTHAHIDHSGLLPKLTASGFTGPIHTTDATAELLAVMLPDSAHVQQADAERASRRREPAARQPSADAAPLYSMQDAVDCLRQLQTVRYDEQIEPHAGVRCRFRDAGHILGSAILELWVTEGGKTTKLVLSGDLGQPGRPILRDPATIADADVLFIESTYGDRAHKDQTATLDELAQVVDHTLNVKHGNVIVPAFAVGRTQEVIYHLQCLSREGRLRNLHIHVDSPMAAAATRITMRHLELFDEPARRLADWHANGGEQPLLRFTASVEESMALNRIRAGAIIVAASGMCDAGRVKHHLRHNLGRRECSVLITGFQAEGTLGRRLVDGAKRVSIFGEEIAVRASIHTLGGFSAHADQPALLAWAAGFAQPPRQTFVVHGEEAAALALAERLRSERGWNVSVPARGQTIGL